MKGSSLLKIFGICLLLTAFILQPFYVGVCFSDNTGTDGAGGGNAGEGGSNGLKQLAAFGIVAGLAAGLFFGLSSLSSGGSDGGTGSTSGH